MTNALKTGNDEGTDAVCFTAGTEVAAFGAGTIHAYLATDRPYPVVVAGISSGAIVAAVMRRCYEELRKSEKGENSARWAFFRRYLEHLTNKPFEVLWNALPDSADFFADHPPISDPSTPEKLRQDEHVALMQRWNLVRLGRWLIHLPIGVRDVARVGVAYVRYKEKYPSRLLYRWLYLAFTALRLGWHLTVRLAIKPSIEREKAAPPSAAGVPGSKQPPPRLPLFGFRVWLGACAVMLLGYSATLLLAADVLAVVLKPAANRIPLPEFLQRWALWWTHASYWQPAYAPLCVALIVIVVLALWACHNGIVRHLFVTLRIDTSIISNYYLKNLLFSLFGEDHIPPRKSNGPHPVIVAAPLQTLHRNGRPLIARQLFAASGTSIVDALLTATALPGIFKPTQLDPGTKTWGEHDNDGLSVQLIDGAAIRNNPLPAFFHYLAENPELGKRLANDAPSVHVVYSVPIAARKRETIPDEAANVVDVGLAALRLNRRCDTQLEVEQTNFLSRLYRAAPADHKFSIEVDEIAPDPDKAPLASLGWSAEAARQAVADGCKRTLQVLHTKSLRNGLRPCRDFAGSRVLNGLGPGKKPGVAEICRLCDGLLSVPAPAASANGQAVKMDAFPQLKREQADQPRIVLIASGGVFRGAFHVGMAGAMWVANAKPDLVVGASVGTLMGGVVAAMFQSKSRKHVPPQLAELVTAFMEVDQRIALTKTLKSAARELGLRGRSIELSPAEVRSAVMRGSRGDPGFAATGAPPVLIDALSDLFMIPREGTTAVARRFIAGDVTGAVAEFGRLAKAHTLPRFGIENAFMGASLIEGVARKLLGDPEGRINLKTHQPYMRKGSPNPHTDVALFATSTDLGTESMFWLGDESDLELSEYDFVEAALASSAFPFVFSPRRASDLFPGNGSREKRYSDGGLFDNLPFGPATALLARAQSLGVEKGKLREALEGRVKAPDLFMVGALDLNPETDPAGSAEFKDRAAIGKRGGALRKNVKIRSFERVATKVDQQLRAVCASATIDPVNEEFLKHVVNAAVLPIFPSDMEHINPTFAFCATLDFKPERVALSIANGCFQTLASLAVKPSTSNEQTLAERSLEALRKNRIAHIIRLKQAPGAAPATASGKCPYFSTDGGKTGLLCPFQNGAAGDAVHSGCVADPVHTRDARASWEAEHA